jgi:hypothetical protein
MSKKIKVKKKKICSVECNPSEMNLHWFCGTNLIHNWPLDRDVNEYLVLKK